MLKIARRVGLTDPSGVRFVRHLHREEAARLASIGAILPVVECGKVVEFRLAAGARVDLSGVRAGSFGIQREHVPVNHQYGLSGGIVFTHRTELYEGLAA